jgi:hypothetical protein
MWPAVMKRLPSPGMTYYLQKKWTSRPIICKIMDRCREYMYIFSALVYNQIYDCLTLLLYNYAVLTTQEMSYQMMMVTGWWAGMNLEWGNHAYFKTQSLCWIMQLPDSIAVGLCGWNAIIIYQEKALCAYNAQHNKSKAVLLHAMEALVGRGGIAPTHSRPRH